MAIMLDKLAWTPIKDRAVLFARSRDQELFYTVGGKRELDEDDIAALVREAGEETGVFLLPGSITHLFTFEGPGHGKAEGMTMKMICYTADYRGRLAPHNEVVELAWFTTADMHRTTDLGRTILQWFKDKDLID